MKVTTIINDVAKELVDEDNTSFAKSQLLTYYNAAVSFVVSARPDAYSKTETFVCAEGAYQQLPVTALRLIDVIYNTDTGEPITQIDRKSLDNLFKGWYRPATFEDEAEFFLYDDRSPREFYLYPAVNAGTNVQAIFNVLPAYVEITDFDTDTQKLLIPLAYIEAIKLFMLYRAYLKESETQDIPKASQYLTTVQTMLGIKTQSDSQTSPNKQG